MLKLRRDSLSRSPWCTASREDLQAAVQSLRDNFIAYIGPFVIQSSTAVFKVSDYLLTADEVVDLYKMGNLTQKGLASFPRYGDATAERFSISHSRLMRNPKFRLTK